MNLVQLCVDTCSARAFRIASETAEICTRIDLENRRMMRRIFNEELAKLGLRPI